MSPPPSSALAMHLQDALASRDARWIRRRLPDPSASPSSVSPSSPPVDFNSNDYLSLSQSPSLRTLFLAKLSAAPDILGSGGSRLLVNGRAHSALEARLASFFKVDAALLFNSGFDANVGFFACIPQKGDALVYDEYIHASVHDGMRSSRVARDAQVPFPHNDVPAFKNIISRLKDSQPSLEDATSSVFIAVESLYSMDGTFSPLAEIVEAMEETFPKGNAYLVVDEAHATGIYGPQGRGRVAQLGLEDKVLARLHTFGKALAASGAVILTNALIRDYMLNYARSLIYTTSLTYANIIAADCSFDMLEDKTAEYLSDHLLSLSTYFVDLLRPYLSSIPSELLSLPPFLLSSSSSAPPSPIIPLHTSHPRPLSAYLLALGMNARPITWPTVPKGKDRVRVCLHAGNTRAEVEALVAGVRRWVGEVLVERGREKERVRAGKDRREQGEWVESKL
ncbi:pyridoxal phosphate-dependent transferase [Crucibulum laeve]|uniref:Pyridoxal phosphate-dependent transferase n=1 Tax=Crucibulum laeve TaxID=68775 RepID=A0A5C3LRC5_9AGAR|nr:pyridoxal phosphate-dependent transferase [Crucibulum laeve]